MSDVGERSRYISVKKTPVLHNTLILNSKVIMAGDVSPEKIFYRNWYIAPFSDKLMNSQSIVLYTPDLETLFVFIYLFVVVAFTSFVIHPFIIECFHVWL